MKKLGLICLVLLCVVFDLALAEEVVHTTAKLSQARWRLASTTVGSRAIFAGGYSNDSSSFSDVVDIYDYSTGQWSTSHLSQARCDLVGATVGTKAIFAGGYYEDYTWSNVIDIYDTATHQWSVMNLPYSGHDYSAVGVGSKVVFAGGTGNNKFTGVFDFDTGQWTTSTLSAGRYNMAHTGVDNLAIFAGGNVGGTKYSNVDIYDADTGLWSVASLSQARHGLGATTIGDMALFAGGTTNAPVSTVDIYDSSDSSWSVTQMPGPLGQPAGASVDNRFAFFAGAWSTDNVYMFDGLKGIWDTFSLSGGDRYGITATSVGNQALFAGGGDYSQHSDYVDIYTVVPEPGTIVFVGLGGMILRRKRK